MSRTRLRFTQPLNMGHSFERTYAGPVEVRSDEVNADGFVVARLVPRAGLMSKMWQIATAQGGWEVGQLFRSFTIEQVPEEQVPEEPDPDPTNHEHVILTALVVETPRGRKEAMKWLAEAINLSSMRHPEESDGFQVESWWFAEDDRTDGSDCESAVFIPYDFQQQISQSDARTILEAVYEIIDNDTVASSLSVEQIVSLLNNRDVWPDRDSGLSPDLAHALALIHEALNEEKERES
jgi:hypothetical protein